MTKIIVLPVFMSAGIGEGTPQQDSNGEIWPLGRILLFIKTYSSDILNGDVLKFLLLGLVPLYQSN